MRRRLGNSVASDYAAELITDSLGIVPPVEEDSAPAVRDNAVGGEEAAVKKRKPRRKKRKRPSDTDNAADTDSMSSAPASDN